MESMGRHFDTIRGTQADAARVAARLAGQATHDNLAHLCPADHALKTETQWRYVRLPDGTIQWTSPTGRTFIGEPTTIIRAPERDPNPHRPCGGRPWTNRRHSEQGFGRLNHRVSAGSTTGAQPPRLNHRVRAAFGYPRAQTE